MKNRLQLVKILTSTKLFLKYDQKRDQAKCKALEI